MTDPVAMGVGAFIGTLLAQVLYRWWTRGK